MSCIMRCLSCIFCDFMCCECNCILFPAPACDYELEEGADINSNLKWEITTFNSVSNPQIQEGRIVPYLKISTKQSRKSKKCFIYFHGNAEDIGTINHFIEPIVRATNITFYAIEYPSYGVYYSLSAALISNTIKEDALNFYQYLKIEMSRNSDDIYVMGRSIGSGGASFLAGNRSVPILILMSPLDSIKKVSKGIIGCLGGIVKQHFNNEEEIVKFNGKLLVIHGEEDEVIKISHGKNLVNIYETQNSLKNVARKIYPRRMTHNNFEIRKDIIIPILQFLQNVNIND